MALRRPETKVPTDLLSDSPLQEKRPETLLQEENMTPLTILQLENLQHEIFTERYKLQHLWQYKAHLQSEECHTSSVWSFKQLLQVWLLQPLLSVLVFGELPKHLHDFILKDFRNWLCFCCPVVDIPVITRLVNQAIIKVQLLFIHSIQVFFGKETEQKTVFKHASLATLVQ